MYPVVSLIRVQNLNWPYGDPLLNGSYGIVKSHLEGGITVIVELTHGTCWSSGQVGQSTVG